MSAISDLQEFLLPDEKIEGIVFGEWGYDGQSYFDEPNPPPVPKDKRGIVLTFDEAQQYMCGWTFNGNLGLPNCYSAYIWTNKRVIWVTQYDGSTTLDSAPRHPMNIMPDMPGG